MKPNFRLILLAMLLLLPNLVSAQSGRKFEIKDGFFTSDNKPVTIMSGEMHYPRIPQQYWRHRMQMLKAMGLNCIATYVFWNIHEVEPDKWDFSGDKDLAKYIQTAQEEGLMVILRPGPYACAEWEFGGYPWWLQNIEGMVLREDNPEFLKRTDLYIKRLYKEVAPLLSTNGGPIIMVQVENEFGSYASQREDIPMERHRTYNHKIKEQLVGAGFDTELFTSDGTWLFEGGSIDNILPTGNGENSVENLREAVNKHHQGVGPYMVAEFYPGWLAHWCEPHPRIDAGEIARQTEEYLRNNVSFNLYMAHGGTNFGFSSGANYDADHDIQPDLTSYDYDAPISEAGWETPKFDSLRKVIMKYSPEKLPNIPLPIECSALAEIQFSRVTDILALAKRTTAVSAKQPLSFEQLQQGYGYVLYSRKFNQPFNGTLSIEGLRDYAVVYVNGKKAGELNRYSKTYSIKIEIPFNATLDILVENMGRINYGSEIVNNNKGITSEVKIGDYAIVGNWNMYKLPMSEVPVAPKGATIDIAQCETLRNKPAMYEAEFELEKATDTFLDMSKFGKGIVFVNGHNIGRYWNEGPQLTLYVPGVWLNKGSNHIMVFDQLNNSPNRSLTTTITPILDFMQ